MIAEFRSLNPKPDVECVGPEIGVTSETRPILNSEIDLIPGVYLLLLWQQRK